MMITSLAVGVLYLLGALGYWKKLEYHEAFMSRVLTEERKEDIICKMVPWQRNALCALWFIAVPLEWGGMLLARTAQDMDID